MAESPGTTTKDYNDKLRKRQKKREKDDMSECRGDEEGHSESIPECAVCLQTCVHPAKLPCSHIFCFLCLKGLATQNRQSRRCAMCRQDIPLDYLDHPNLLEVPTEPEKETLEDGYQWFYEGRSGWWQYEERTSRELEAAYKGGQRTCELLIVGQLYIADFDAMLQLRCNDMSRRRRIKRDLASIPKKGIAGLRVDGSCSSSSESNEAVDVTTSSQLSAPSETVESIPDNSEAASSEPSELVHAEDAWQSDQGTDFLLSEDYRRVIEEHRSNEDLSDTLQNVESSQIPSNFNESSPSTDQTELENQLTSLQLN